MRAAQALIMGGAGAPALGANVPSGSFERTAFDPADATCNIGFNASGSYTVTSDSGASGTWKFGGVGADYEIRWSGGGLSTGTGGVWHSLAGNITFGITRTVSGTSSTTGTVEIRMAAAPNTVLDSGEITLSAIVEI